MEKDMVKLVKQTFFSFSTNNMHLFIKIL